MAAINTTVPRYLFLDEVAEVLRRSVPAVRHLIVSGQLPAGKVGGRTVVKPDVLESFIEAGFEQSE